MLGCSVCRSSCQTDAVPAAALQAFDFDAVFVQRLLDAAPPTLTCVQLAIGPDMGAAPALTYWTITRLADGHKRLEQVSDDDLDTIHAIQTMCLPEEAAVSTVRNQCVACF